MELLKFKKLFGELNSVEPEELIALYVEAKTGLENPLIELPLHLRFSLCDIKDWVDNYNKQQTVK